MRDSSGCAVTYGLRAVTELYCSVDVAPLYTEPDALSEQVT